MMDLVDKIILAHLSDADKSPTPAEADAEEKRVEDLNSLPLEDFLMLPDADKELAEDVWAAKVMQVSLLRQRERSERLEKEFDFAD